MAKVTEPIDPFLISKRLGFNIVLRNRKEGLTVSIFKPLKAASFFEPESDTITKEIIQERWDNLTTEEKETWNEWGEEIGLTGEQLYKLEEKKSMSTGIYNLAKYGGTKVYGVLLTKYSTVYNLAIYGVNKYTGK